MKGSFIVPWLCGALLLFGPLVPEPNTIIFYRSMLLVVVLLAMGGSIAAARMFQRGDLLFTTWAVLASGYTLLAVRYLLRLLVNLHLMETPVMFDRVLLIVHNVLVPVALWLFVRSWRKTGLAGPMDRGKIFAWTLAGFAVAIAIGAFPLMKGFRNSDPALFVSTLGDMISIALIVPLLVPALGMRGGLLMYTWLYLAMSLVAWLMYDIWAVSRANIGVSAVWGLAIDQALRAVALMYIFVAAASQRRALAQTRNLTPRETRLPAISESPVPS